MIPFELTANHTVQGTTYRKGQVVYRCNQPDYGCTRDDTNILGVEHLAMTLDPNGGYPFFTVPVTKLKEREHPQLRAMHDNEERRFRDRVGETQYARLKEIERTQGLEAARAEARRVEQGMETE